jgi:hypothetical protein
VPLGEANGTIHNSNVVLHDAASALQRERSRVAQIRRLRLEQQARGGGGPDAL